MTFAAGFLCGFLAAVMLGLVGIFLIVVMSASREVHRA